MTTETDAVVSQVQIWATALAPLLPVNAQATLGLVMTALGLIQGVVNGGDDLDDTTFETLLGRDAAVRAAGRLLQAQQGG